ncbi:hydrogenase [Marinicaulis flavus]|uniref:Hydrogenase n=2 Tax=Hyphococcus luteus TaxID=2058213 RepID=A0A2S7K8F4_9PROT|nr:hydrogenase [Marinicaulis flavus]
MQLGAVLLLLGLLTGLAVPMAALPRMALASHLEAILNGMLLIILGVIWTRLVLGPRQRIAAFWLVIYAAFANWTATLISAFTGAAAMMPLAGGGSAGAAPFELAVATLLLSLTLAILIGVGLVIYGLRPARA